MKFVELVEELSEKDFFKTFIRDNPGAFLSAGFFILDLKDKTEKIQLDYFLPKESKVVGFEYPFVEARVFDDKIDGMKVLSTDLSVDVGNLEFVSNSIIKSNKSLINPTKIIAVLRDNEWNLTCMDDALGIVRIRINALTGEEISFDKGSLMDFMGIKKGK